MFSKNIEIDKTIKEAMKKGKPIVALESTLISHGLPYPENIEVARLSIDAIKKNGSIPALIGIINGKIKVGLTNNEINILAKNKKVVKVSRHNLAIAINKKNHAATTVASTIFIASKLGIKFFATGGIGGVHIESEKTFDISSDLYELQRTKMYIVCSGAKSILDIDKTYEKLETLGIPRIGFNTKYMPGFWYYKTNKELDANFSNINLIVDYLKDYENLNFNNSVLIFNPVPKSKAIEKKEVQKWLKISLSKAKKNKIEGKALTPFLIKEINILSKNKTLKSNIELIINNASLAVKIAKKFT